MESRSLDEVAIIRDASRINVRGTQRILRKGPYRLYVEAGWVPFDDYTFDGDVLILGDVCDVVSPNGCLSVQRAQGRCSVTDTHHVIEAIDPDDSDYLYRMLRCMPAEGIADIASQTARLSQKNLQAIRIPWPSKDVRHAFCAFLDRCQARRSDAAARVTACQREGEALCSHAYGDHAPRTFRLADGFDIEAGSFLSADKRAADGRYPVVSAQGIAGFTDSSALTHACVAVGATGNGLSVQYLPEGAWPLSDTIAITAKTDMSGMPASTPSLELLYFLLSNDEGAAVARSWARHGDTGSLFEFFSSIELECPQESEWEHLGDHACRCLLEIAEHRAHMSDLALQSHSIMRDMLNMRDEAVKAIAYDSAEASAPSVPPKQPNVLAAVSSPVRQALAHMVQDTYRRMMPCSHEGLQGYAPFDADGTESPANALFDAAWEVIPLVYLRARRSDADWRAMVSAADCRPMLDAWISEEAARSVSLSYLQGLSCGQSALDEEARWAVVRELQEVEPCDLKGSDMLWMHASYLPPMPSSSACVCPTAVSQLLCGCARAFQQRVDSIFDPSCGTSGLLALMHAAYPRAQAAGQAPDFSAALITALAASLDGWVIPDGCLAAGPSLLDDAYAGRTADLVMSLLPPNAAEWTNARPDPLDARWAFGEPPRNKANLAWLQHAFSHRSKGGTAILVLCDAVLHESRGCEPRVRSSLIDSGCVRAVISLPGRVFEDHRNPSCIMVLGDARPGACSTLFVDASDKGTDRADGSRTLPLETAQVILEAVDQWASTGCCLPDNGFCVAASKDAMLGIGDLTPWTYVHRSL